MCRAPTSNARAPPPKRLLFGDGFCGFCFGLLSLTQRPYLGILVDFVAELNFGGVLGYTKILSSRRQKEDIVSTQLWVTPLP